MHVVSLAHVLNEQRRGLARNVEDCIGLSLPERLYAVGCAPIDFLPRAHSCLF
jgi:hypothetical protein